MQIFSSLIIGKAAKDWNIEVDARVRRRKDVHYNVLISYARSQLMDHKRVKDFIAYVKALHRGGARSKTCGGRLR